MWVEVQRHEGSHKEAFATEKEQCYAAIRKSGLIINAKKQTMVTACNCLLPTPNQNVRCPSKVPMSGWGGVTVQAANSCSDCDHEGSLATWL